VSALSVALNSSAAAGWARECVRSSLEHLGDEGGAAVELATSDDLLIGLIMCLFFCSFSFND
jgi:hypothetical protein